MGVTHASKTPDTAMIPCGGTFHVTLALTAEPDLVSKPIDVVLLLDRSGSMAGKPLESLKKAARTFVDILDEATDGVQDGQIGGGSRIGIVSFASTATADAPLMTSVQALRAAIDGLRDGGSTNHADAFSKGAALFDPASANARILVIFTDGVTTAGPPPAPIAEAAKTQGAVIYCIGLSGSGGPDEQALRDWASDPDDAYVAITPDDEDLEDLFAGLAENLSKPGATDIVIDETVTACFRILSADTPTKGAVTLTGDRSLQWKIAELGVRKSEGAELRFTVRHEGVCSGDLPINESITYHDHEGNHVDFGDPEIEVDCGVDTLPEPCPTPVEIHIDGCEDSVEFNAGALALESLGRILQLDVTLKNVCPNRRVALAVVLTEVDDKGGEHKRGLKTLVIPAHHRTGCRDIKVRCVKFVLPEELDVSGRSDGICDRRNFKARLFAHYIDNDFECCHP